MDGKSGVHYLWIAAMTVCTLTILTAVVLAIRSPGINRRWLWITGSLFGLAQFTLNWSTGAWDIRPLSISLFGSGMMKPSPFEPWLLNFSLPVVAVIFLFCRKRLIERQDQEEAAAF